MTVSYAKHFEFFRVLSIKDLFFYFDSWESYTGTEFITCVQFKHLELSYGNLKLKGYK